jgi:hypothetical protein
MQSSISSKKCGKILADYVWSSVILKPIFFNPFILTLLIIILISSIDIIDKKTFINCNLSFLLQHIITSYLVIGSAIVMNNMLIKHKYRLEKNNLESNLDSKLESDISKISDLNYKL